MKKRIGSLVLLLLLVIVTGGVIHAQESSVRIIHNGGEVQFLPGEGRLIIDENSRTLVPVRKISELLGAAVSWNQDTRTATVTKDDMALQITIGDQAIRTGNRLILMDTSARLIEGRTYLPLRAIAENLGYQVLWDAQSQSIGFELLAGGDEAIEKAIKDQLAAPRTGDSVALIKTSLGDIRIKLLGKEAPKAVENFIGLAKKGYYDNLTFHRVIPDFMIQGGDPLGTGTGGQSIWGAPFEDEFSPNAHNFRGALSMANSGPNTNGSQFFIVQLPPSAMTPSQIPMGAPSSLVDAYTRIGGTPWLDDRHTVFGQVYAGMDVVDRVAGVKTDALNKPVDAVRILSVTIETIQ